MSVRTFANYLDINKYRRYCVLRSGEDALRGTVEFTTTIRLLSMDQVSMSKPAKTATRDEALLFEKYCELFPNYAWTDAETAIALMVAEITTLRIEKERILESFTEFVRRYESK